jgi:hypothetical protein
LVTFEDQPLGYVPVDGILTFGKDVLVVDDKVDSMLIATIEEVIEKMASIEPKTEPGSGEQISAGGDGLKIFEDRQRQYLIGKKIIRSIFLDNGELLAQEGETVTMELLERVRTKDKFIELTASVES